MDWLENLFNMTPNAVGDARREIEPAVAGYRNANGSFDPNAIRDMVPKEVQGEADLQMKLADMRRQALISHKPEPMTGLKWLGGVLGEAAVPVAYAQGNTGYANAMNGQTPFAKYNARVAGYEDDAAKAKIDITDKALSGVGDSAIGYMQKVREKRESARQMVAKTIAVARIRGGAAGEAEAAKSAATYLRSLGLKEDADSIESNYGAKASPVGQPTVLDQSALPDVPGIAVAGGGQAAGQSPALSAPQSLQAPQSGPSLLSPKRATAAQLEPYDPDAAKALLAEAEIDEKPGLAGAVKSAEVEAEGIAKTEAKRQSSIASSDKVGALFDQLASYADVPGMDSYTGSIQGSSVAPYTTDYLAALSPGNQATPAIRDMIKGGQMALVAILKNNIRTPGEGSQDQREFQAVIDTIGDMTNANTVDDYWAKLRDAKTRVENLTGVAIPAKDKRLSAVPKEQETPVPAPAAAPAIGTVKQGKDGNYYTYGSGGWYPTQAPPQARPIPHRFVGPTPSKPSAGGL